MQHNALGGTVTVAALSLALIDQPSMADPLRP
jgi:hypothetical protein